MAIEIEIEMLQTLKSFLGRWCGEYSTDSNANLVRRANVYRDISIVLKRIDLFVLLIYSVRATHMQIHNL